MRLVIELKRDAIPKVVLNKLYKHTPMQTTFGVNMVALVDGVPRTLSLREVDPRLRRPPARGHRPPHEVRAAPDGGARPHPRGPAGRARQPRRGHRADPRLARPRRRAPGADGAVRALAGPGARHPRDAPAPAHRAGEPTRSAPSTRTSSSASGSCARSSATRTRVMGLIKEELPEISEHLRRRAPHRDHPLRGRDRHRGPDRRPADGHRDHARPATSSRCRWPPTASRTAAASA